MSRALIAAHPDDRFVLYEHTLRKSDATARVAGSTRHTGRRLMPALGTRLGLSVERWTGPLDVLHLTDYALLRTRRAPIVAMIHDVLFETLPACYPTRKRRGLRAVTEALLRTAAHVVVPSDRVRRGVVDHFAMAADRVHVTPLGHRPLPQGDAAAAGAVPGARPYILVVGTLMPRKNHMRLIQAYQALPDLDANLVIAGARGWRDEPIVEAAQQSARIEFIEAPDDATLARLYAGAHVVAQPSLDEGFGLPVVEALAMGIPVLVGCDTTCADVAGDAALAVDVNDVESIRDGLGRLLADETLRASLATAGPQRAAQFTWERTADATYAVYEQALS